MAKSATDPNSPTTGSGIAYYMNTKHNKMAEWTKTNNKGEPLVTEATNVTAYQEGPKLLFVRICR